MLFFDITASCWALCLVFSFLRMPSLLLRILVCLGCVTGIIGSVLNLPLGMPSTRTPFSVGGTTFNFSLDGAALWLLVFGLFPAFFACWISGSVQKKRSQRYWLGGVSTALLGALGVFGLQDAISFLIAWELMSLGVAVMLLGEYKEANSGAAVLLMLSLLEVGAVAILVALLLLSGNAINMEFSSFAQNAQSFSPAKQFLIGILLLFGFGAKLGLIPFYEWMPNAYSAGSGASGVIASGIILNAAFYGLMRGLFVWLSKMDWGLAFGMLVILLAVITAIWVVMHAFQQKDWRALLSFSSAENAAIGVVALGAGILFKDASLPDLAGLAGTVALIQIAGHSLAKGAMFLVADGVFSSQNNYDITQNGLLKKTGWMFGVGALFAAMSLAAMPPQVGFVSEWYIFQTIFHGFVLDNLAARLALIAAGAGMALTVAIALATVVKAFGVGLLGTENEGLSNPVPQQIKFAVFILGLSILVLSVGMLIWINSLGVVIQNWFQFNSPNEMTSGFLLVPLSDKFAFISPTLLVIVTPLLALLPILFIALNLRYKIKRVPVWYGGLPQDPRRVSTTALTFSNAMHYFYRFIYLHKHEVKREYRLKPYFVKSILFTQESTAIFSVYLFNPIIKFINYLAEKIKLFQSGNLNFYNFVIAVLFIVILLISVL